MIENWINPRKKKPPVNLNAVLFSYLIENDCWNEWWIWFSDGVRFLFGQQLQLNTPLTIQTCQHIRIRHIHQFDALENEQNQLIQIDRWRSSVAFTNLFASIFSIPVHLACYKCYNCILIIAQCIRHTRLQTIARTFGWPMLAKEVGTVIFTLQNNNNTWIIIAPPSAYGSKYVTDFSFSEWHELHVDVTFECIVGGRKLIGQKCNTIRTQWFIVDVDFQLLIWERVGAKKTRDINIAWPLDYWITVKYLLHRCIAARRSRFVRNCHICRYYVWHYHSNKNKQYRKFHISCFFFLLLLFFSSPKLC